MIAADAIVKCLEKEGVEYVFGYPGVAICPFFNSILDTNIKTILVRQEQNAHGNCYCVRGQYPAGVHHGTG